MASLLAILQSIFPPKQGVVSPVPDDVVSGFDTKEDPETKKLRSAIVSFYKSKMPKSEKRSVEEYYPVMENLDDILSKEQVRPGLGALGALQAFYESTGGRTTPNIFGVKPQGKSRRFESNKEAIDYQFGPKVLGGGSGDRLNVMKKHTPLTQEEIEQMYQAYNPEGQYLPQLLNDFSLVMGK